MQSKVSKMPHDEYRISRGAPTIFPTVTISPDAGNLAWSTTQISTHNAKKGES
jgi:hypothetical protein